jgi:peptidoglycan/xylan/chitin deacetylase (PgdA/CDA1 family)
MSGFKKLNIILLVLLFAFVVIDVFFDFHWAWYLSLFFVDFVICIYGSFVLSAQFFTSVKYKGDRTSKKIALTFDDGPLPSQTERILTVLAQYQIKASFFCIGQRVAQHPHLLKQVHEHGHLIGNHTFHHSPVMGFSSLKKVVSELTKTNTQIEQVIGKLPRFFRPPYGVTNPNIAEAIGQGKYQTIGWSIRSFDTIIRDQNMLYKRITRSLKGGDIVLLHDYSEATIQVLPRLIKYAHQNGLVFVRLDELLNEEPYR